VLSFISCFYKNYLRSEPFCNSVYSAAKPVKKKIENRKRQWLMPPARRKIQRERREYRLCSLLYLYCAVNIIKIIDIKRRRRKLPEFSEKCRRK
jgi:hypothetical protein